MYTNNYYPGTSLSDSGLEGLIVIAIVFYGLLAIFSLATYIMTSIALTRMGGKANIPNPWLAWFPIGNLYVMGAIVGEMKYLGLNLKRMGVKAIVIPLIGGVLATIIQVVSISPRNGNDAMIGIGIVVILVIYVLEIIFAIKLIYNVFARFVPESATVFTILSLLISIPYPFLMLSASKKSYIGANDRNNPNNIQGYPQPSSLVCANCEQSINFNTVYCPVCGNKIQK